MGVRVRDERPYEITPVDAPVTHISDFGLHPVVDAEIGDDVRQAFEDVLWRALTGRLASDRINGLILGAGLGWRDTIVLRTITRYLRQGGTTFSDHYLMSTLLAHPDIAGMLVELFEARLDPERADPARAEELDARIVTEIEAVASLDEDRILTLYLTVVRAVLRTNHWLGTDTLALKLDSSAIALLPQPRPWVEVFVYSQATEGVHLRGGPIARGGLRWSDRHEDFRTEILGLMKAQMVKNALIVPVGAKGGFVVKTRRGRRRLPHVRGRAARRHRQRRGGPDRPARGRGAPRRRRCVPRRGGGQGHGDVLRRGERDRGRARLLARGRVRVGRVGRLRPQAHGHHRAGRVGVRAPPLPRAGHRRRQRGDHRRRDRRHVGRRVRQRDAAQQSHPARRGVRPPARLPRPGSRRRRGVRRARAAVRARALDLGRLRPLAHLRGRRRLPAHDEGDPRCRPRRAARSASTRSRCRRTSSSRRSCARRSTCCGAAGSAPTSSTPRRRTPRRATGRTTASASTATSCAAASSARAATSASPSSAASSTRSTAAASSRTRSTTRAA